MNKIKEFRKIKGATQKELAEYLNIAQNTLSYWERGEYEPDNTSLIKMSDFFGVSVDELLGKTNITNNKEMPPTEDDIKIALFGGAGEVTDEMWEEAQRAIDIIKSAYSKKSNKSNKS